MFTGTSTDAFANKGLPTFGRLATLPPQDEQDKKIKSGKSSDHENPDSDIKEIWTGNYLFENEWQSFRTKKNATLEFTSIPHEYKQAGKYKVMVKVVDILGIDTSKIVEVKI